MYPREPLEMKISLDGIKSRLNATKENISELEDIPPSNKSKTKQRKKKRLEKMPTEPHCQKKENVNNIKQYNLCN